MPGNPYDVNTLYEAVERAEILSDVKPEIAFVDRGYRGVEIEGVHIWKSGQKRSVTQGRDVGYSRQCLRDQLFRLKQTLERMEDAEPGA